MMKTSLLLCAVLFLAFAANAQCALVGGKIGKPLRVRLLTEDDVPVSVQSAFLNALRVIPDVEVHSGQIATASDDDIVVYVMGFSNRLTDGTLLGAIWHYQAYRLWFCGAPTQSLEERLDEGLQASPLSHVEAAVKDQVAKINVNALEKLRQERDAFR